MNRQTRKFFYGLIIMIISFLLLIFELKTHIGKEWTQNSRIVLYSIMFLIGLNKIRQTTKK